MNKALLALIIYIAVLCVLSMQDARADEYGFTASFASYHTIDNNYNEINPGAGLVIYNDDMNRGYQIGFYRNSEDKNTIYAAVKFYFSKCGIKSAYGRCLNLPKVRPFAVLGVATGYSHAPVVVYPAAGVDINIYEDHYLNVLTAPLITADGEVGAIFGFQYEFKFSDGR